MDRELILQHLKQAERHVFEGERVLGHQRSVIEHFRRDGHSESMIDAAERLLRIRGSAKHAGRRCHSAPWGARRIQVNGARRARRGLTSERHGRIRDLLIFGRTRRGRTYCPATLPSVAADPRSRER